MVPCAEPISRARSCHLFGRPSTCRASTQTVPAEVAQTDPAEPPYPRPRRLGWGIWAALMVSRRTVWGFRLGYGGSICDLGVQIGVRGPLTFACFAPVLCLDPTMAAVYEAALACRWVRSFAFCPCCVCTCVARPCSPTSPRAATQPPNVWSVLRPQAGVWHHCGALRVGLWLLARRCVPCRRVPPQPRRHGTLY